MPETVAPDDPRCAASPSRWKDQAAFHTYSSTCTKSHRIVTSIPRLYAWAGGAVDLVAIAVHQRHLRACLGRVTAAGLVEDLAHDGGDVIDDAGGQPLVSRTGPGAAVRRCLSEAGRIPG
jgi:hypothetical protein